MVPLILLVVLLGVLDLSMLLRGAHPGTRWPFRRNPLTGMFPAAHQSVGGGPLVLHTGGAHAAVLTIPVANPGS